MRFTAEQYQQAKAACEAGLSQLEPDGGNCAICGDSGHQAWECGHNPLLAMAMCEELSKKAEELHEVLHQLGGFNFHMGEQLGPAKIVLPDSGVRIEEALQEAKGEGVLLAVKEMGKILLESMKEPRPAYKPRTVRDVLKDAEAELARRMEREPCPKCGRPLATIDDFRAMRQDGNALAGLCPTGYAIRDPDAAADCDRYSKDKLSRPATDRADGMEPGEPYPDCDELASEEEIQKAVLELRMAETMPPRVIVGNPAGPLPFEEPGHNANLEHRRSIRASSTPIEPRPGYVMLFARTRDGKPLSDEEARKLCEHVNSTGFSAPDIMSPEQSREENKAAFIKRLVGAGWSAEDAAAEYERECG